MINFLTDYIVLSCPFKPETMTQAKIFWRSNKEFYFLHSCVINLEIHKTGTEISSAWLA